MQHNTAHATESCPIATAAQNENELPPSLPANVVRAIRLLDKLAEQAAEIRRCAESMRANVSSVLGRW